MPCSKCRQLRRQAIQSAKAGNVQATAKAVKDGAMVALQKMLLGSRFKGEK